MRETHICPKCRHDHVLLIHQVPDAGEYPNQISAMHVATVSGGFGFFGIEKLAGAGQLMAVVCRRCGYTEMYTRDADKIPIDGRYVREGVGKPPEPYR